MYCATNVAQGYVTTPVQAKKYPHTDPYVNSYRSLGASMASVPMPLRIRVWVDAGAAQRGRQGHATQGGQKEPRAWTRLGCSARSRPGGGGDGENTTPAGLD